jgi:hypothetical protein
VRAWRKDALNNGPRQGRGSCDTRISQRTLSPAGDLDCMASRHLDNRSGGRTILFSSMENKVSASRLERQPQVNWGSRPGALRLSRTHRLAGRGPTHVGSRQGATQRRTVPESTRHRSALKSSAQHQSWVWNEQAECQQGQARGRPAGPLLHLRGARGRVTTVSYGVSISVTEV